MRPPHDGLSAVSQDAGLRAGVRIVNARGIPGTLGCFALTLDDRRLVFLTSHHVVFGDGAREQQPIWIAAEGKDLPFRRLARARHGRCGPVTHAGTIVFVDCATVELNEPAPPAGWRVVEDSKGQAPPLAAGDPVTKTGATTGTTHGTVVETEFSERVRLNGRTHEARGQILVRPSVPGSPFTADGDSGAVLRNRDGSIVGLLWGADPRGYGLACPIDPVLRVLHVCLARLEPAGAS